MDPHEDAEHVPQDFLRPHQRRVSVVTEGGRTRGETMFPDLENELRLFLHQMACSSPVTYSFYGNAYSYRQIADITAENWSLASDTSWRKHVRDQLDVLLEDESCPCHIVDIDQETLSPIVESRF